MKLSVGNKIGGLLGLMILVAVSNLAVIYYYRAEEEHDSMVVNLAGRQRMLSQEITKLALGVAYRDKAEARNQLKSRVNLYGTSLKTLQSGGRIGQTIIPPAPGDSEKLTGLFEANRQIWQYFKKAALTVSSRKKHDPAFAQALEYIRKHNEEALQKSDQVVEAYENLPNGRDYFHEINLVGRQRALTQQITKYVFSLVSEESDNTRRKLLELINICRTSCRVLLQGGKSILSGKEIKPPPSSVRGKLIAWDNLWRPIANQVMVILGTPQYNESFMKAISYLEDNNQELLDVSDRITGTFTGIFSRKEVELRTLLFIMFGTDLIILWLGLVLAKRIARPIKELSRSALKIGAGDFDQNIVVPCTDDEIGELAGTFQKMVVDLKDTTVSKNYLDNIMDSMIDAMLVVDNQRRITRINWAACKLLGYAESELFDLSPEKISQEIFREKSFRERLERGFLIGEYTYRKKNGKHIPVYVSGSAIKNPQGLPIGMVLFSHDITDRKRAEEALKARQREIEELNAGLEKRVREELKKSRQKDAIMIQQSRLAAMGEMIGMIAHQWRQPLNALNLTLYNIQHDFAKKRLNQKLLDDLVNDGVNLVTKMSHTIDDFRSFFKPTKEKEEFSLNQSVHEALSLVSAGFKYSNILVEVNEPEEIRIAGFPNEYSQVVLNILNNARDVLVEKGNAGKITINILKEKNWGVVRIKDNGKGIPTEVFHKIFDPYFTTKREGKGTGLGLYMSKVIIEDHMQGTVKVRNLEGGAEFIISIPG